VTRGKDVDGELILIVDDDQLFCRVLGYQLRARKYRCEHSLSAEEALRKVTGEARPDLILLDYFLGSEEMNGLQLCNKIKALTDIAVIMLTGNDDVRTTISCLDAGADQYIVKPYDLDELTARMRAVLRQRKTRSSSTGAGSQVIWRDVELDPVGRVLGVGGQEVSLSEKEVAVLQVLMRHGGEIVDRSNLYSVIYGRDFDSMNRAMDVLIGRARRKLESVTGDYTIRSARGAGYVLQPARTRPRTKHS